MKVLDKVRSIFNLPRSPRPEADSNSVRIPMVRAGMYVDHDVAMTYSAVYSATRVISETIATLPWRAMRREADGSRTPMPTSPAENVLNRSPNLEMTPFVFRSTLVANALLWGNGYAEIERDMANRVVALWPIPPDRVEVVRDRETKEKLFRIINGSESFYLKDSDVFHLQGPGNGTSGYSVVSLMSKSIGLGLASEEFGSSLFSNGSMPNSYLKHSGKLTPEAQERLKEGLKQYSGPSNAFRTLILEEGMDWQTIGVPPEDAQFLETRKFQITEIARWFRVPPHKLADLERATFSNIEHQSQEFVTDSIMPWVIRLEQEADKKLFPLNRSGMYTKINVNGLLRGDSAARSDYYQKMANLGVFSINDILELEDRDPIGKDGDKRLVQLNQTTLEKIGEEIETPPPVATIDEEDDDEI